MENTEQPNQSVAQQPENIPDETTTPVEEQLEDKNQEPSAAELQTLKIRQQNCGEFYQPLLAVINASATERQKPLNGALASAR